MKGMTGITDAHIFVWRAYNVRVGYSIHIFHETTKINFPFLRTEKDTGNIEFMSIRKGSVEFIKA